jgi:hypothetical protein
MVLKLADRLHPRRAVAPTDGNGQAHLVSARESPLSSVVRRDTKSFHRWNEAITS